MLPKRYWFVLLTYILVQLSTLIFAPLIHIMFKIDIIEASIYWYIISFTIGAIIIVMFMRRDFQLEKKSSQSSLNRILLWMFIGFWMALFAQVIASLVEISIFKIELGSENTDIIVELARMNTLFIIIPAVVGPILEELVFRKVIFASLHKKINFFWAALISSVIFAILHFDFSHLLVYITMGFVFAFLYVKTKRIIVPMFVHMALNSYAVIGQLLFDPEEIERLRQQLSFILFGH